MILLPASLETTWAVNECQTLTLTLTLMGPSFATFAMFSTLTGMEHQHIECHVRDLQARELVASEISNLQPNE